MTDGNSPKSAQGDRPGTSNDRVVKVEAPRRSRWFRLAKRMVQGCFSLLALRRRITLWCARKVMARDAFRYASESIARVPGLRGVYLRQAFYAATLERCGVDGYFGWQSVFSMEEVELGDQVYIGRGCSIGFARIESFVMLADYVQILSGGNEHGEATSEGETMQQQTQTFRQVTIGRGAWIGAGAVVMADVGENTVVGAGAVVTNPLPPNCVAAGVPARVIREDESGSKGPNGRDTGDRAGENLRSPLTTQVPFDERS